MIAEAASEISYRAREMNFTFTRSDTLRCWKRSRWVEIPTVPRFRARNPFLLTASRPGSAGR